MESWYWWDDFLKIVAVDHQLSSTETKSFLSSFLRDNLNKNDQERANFVYGETETSKQSYKKQMGGVYKKLEKSFPQIADLNNDKFPVVSGLLEQKYRTWEPINQDLAKPIINNNSTENNILSNPFIPSNGVIDDNKLFFGRTKEIKRIFEILNSGSSVAIIGERQIGKSSLLKEISRQAQTQLLQPREPIYLNLQDIHDDDDFYQFLCDSVGIDFCKGYRLSRNLQNHRLLLILDELEKMTWEGFTNNIRGQLRGLAEGSNAPLRLVVAGCTSLDQIFPDSQDIGMTSPFTGICIEYNLNRWDEQTIRNFIKSRLNSPLLKPEYQTITFTEDEIIQASQLTPKEFCQEIALYLFETGHLTVGYASQLADMPTDVFRQLLKQRHIPLYSYDVEDFELDLKNLRELGKL
jgi:predicted HTH domain antitoxin